jgi:hypothetical protein
MVTKYILTFRKLSLLGSKHSILWVYLCLTVKKRGRRRGRNRMLVGFTTTCAISAYHH